MYCKNCGKEIEVGSRFCGHCGANLSIPKTQQPTHTKSPLSQVATQKKSNAPKTKSKNTFLKIILAAAAIFFIWTVMEGNEEDKTSNLSTFADQQEGHNDQNYGNDDSSFVYESFGISSSGFLINNQLEPYTYPASDIGVLNGIFRMDAEKQNCVVLGSLDKLGRYELSIEDFNGEVHSGTNLPICVDRSKGEQLIIVGSEWSGRSENDRRNMVIDIYPATLLGYSNSFMLADLDVDEMESVNGISISKLNEDFASVTEALETTGVSCVRCAWYVDLTRYRYRDYLLASQYESVITCGFYEGTQFISMDVSMTHPYVRIDPDNYIALSVQSTIDGYFIIDISQLPSGLYVIDGLIGNDLLVIE